MARAPEYRHRRKIPWWAILLVALACGGLLWRILGSPDDRPASPGDGRSPLELEGAGAQGSEGADVTATVASRFPHPAIGDRLELRALSLGDDPSRCVAVGLRVGGDFRTVYHHRCERYDPDLAFFLVRVTGLADDPVLVERSSFALVTADGRTLEPVAPLGVPRLLPTDVALGPGVDGKGWLIFEDPGSPASLRYTDGEQVLVVRFPNAWR